MIDGGLGDLDERGRESDLYPIIEHWLERSRFECFAWASEVGLGYGRVDVVAIADTGRELSAREELIAIEVKLTTNRFAASVGQALGYSIYAEHCFLACDFRGGRDWGFTDPEREIARQLGVGLLAIRDDGEVDEVLPSKRHQPIDGLRLEIIEKLHYSLCTICQSLFQSGKPDKAWSELVRLSDGLPQNNALRAVNERKGIVYPLREADDRNPTRDSRFYSRRRYVCNDCLRALLGQTQ